jgi:hypothetical protein
VILLANFHLLRIDLYKHGLCGHFKNDSLAKGNVLIGAPSGCSKHEKSLEKKAKPFFLQINDVQGNLVFFRRMRVTNFRSQEGFRSG